jgi:hypothetical protein
MGPGTHIYHRLLTHVLPINQVDAAAMIHDVEYLNPYITEKQADENALANAGSYFNPLKGVMKIGFTLKDLKGGYNSEKNYDMYLACREIIETEYKETVNKYNLVMLSYTKG